MDVDDGSGRLHFISWATVPFPMDSGQWTVDSLVYYFNRVEGGMRRSSSRMRIRRAKRSTTIHHSTPTTFHQ